MLPDAVPESGGDLFLFRALREGMDSGALQFGADDRIMAGLSALASDDMDALVLRESYSTAREMAFAGALHRVTVGLEYAAERSETRGAELLAQSALTTAANTGAAILARVRDRAEATRESLRLTSDLPTALSVLDELILVNTVEDMFLDELTRGRLTIHAAAPRLTEASAARWIASLDDVGTVSLMLGFLDARAELFASFPRERLFAQTYPPDALGGCDAVVICRMLAQAVISDSPEPRFHLTEQDVVDFRATAGGAETLERWIAGRVSAVLPAAQQAPAREYMQACAEVLPQLLDLLI
jgi:hypothetical protein